MLVALLCLAALSEIAPLLGSPTGFFHNSIWFQIYESPLFGSACLGSAFAYWFLLPLKKRELIISLIIGLIIDCVLIKYRLSIIKPIAQLLHIGPGLLCGALLAILWRTWLSFKTNDKAALQKNLEVLGLSLSMPIMLSLGTTIRLSGLLVYDPHCYALDSLWGFQTSFVISKILRNNSVLNIIMNAIYFHLSLYMMLAQVIVYKHDEEAKDSNKHLIPAVLFILIAVCGSALYKFFPVVGVEAYCGLNSFPNGPWPQANPNPLPIEAPPFLARNGMPSLHLSWILAVYYSLYRTKSIYRHIAMALVFLTFLATFSIGCHYLIDLIIAIPFFTALLAASLFGASTKLRWLCFIFGASTTMGWLYLFKYSINYALNMPVTTLSLLVLTDAIALYLANLMCREAKTNPTPESNDISCNNA